MAPNQDPLTASLPMVLSLPISEGVQVFSFLVGASQPPCGSFDDLFPDVTSELSLPSLQGAGFLVLCSHQPVGLFSRSPPTFEKMKQKRMRCLCVCVLLGWEILFFFLIF